MLHLERVWQTDQTCRTQAECSTLGVGRDRNAITLCVGISQRRRRVKVIMQDTVEISDLYRLAHAHSVQIRRLNFKRDSLEDIFLKAMENGDAPANGRATNGGL